MLFNPNKKECDSIRTWAETASKYVQNVYGVDPIEYLKGLSVYTKNEVKDEKESIKEVHYCGGAGLCIVDDLPVPTEGVTIRSAFKCVPGSSCLWDTMFAMTIFDGKPDIEKLNEIFKKNISMRGELSIDGVRRALDIKNKAEEKKAEKSKAEEKKDKKSDEKQKYVPLAEQYPYAEDALFVLAVFCGYKVGSYWKNNINFDYSTLIKPSKLAELGVTNKIKHQRFILGLIARSNNAFARAKYLTEKMDAQLAQKGFVPPDEWKEIETLISGDESIGKLETDISNTEKINFQGESWKRELAFNRNILVDRKDRIEQDKWRLDRIGLRATVIAELEQMQSELSEILSFDEVDRIERRLNEFNSQIASSRYTLDEDYEMAMYIASGYEENEQALMLKAQAEVESFKNDFEAWVSSAIPEIKRLLAEIQTKKNEFAVNRKKSELRSLLATIRESVGTRDRKVAGRNNHAYVFAHLRNTDTGEYINITNREDANKKRQILSSEIQKIDSALASAIALKNQIGQQYFDNEIDDMMAQLKAFAGELATYRDIAEKLASDSSSLPSSRMPDIVAGSETSRTFRDEETGLEITYTLRSDKTSELVFSEGENKSNAVYYYTAYHNVVDSAVDVKRQPVFDDYGDITIYPYVKPFKYQVDSTRAMLSAFSGKGIFGDQVGLGKTVQTLLTAQAMFKCGTIRNAVIVVKNTVIQQWRNEAANKFKKNDENSSPMFVSFPEGGGGASFKELIEQLRKDKYNDKSDQGIEALKLYFISLESLKKAKDEIEKSNRIDAFRRNAYAVFTKNEMPKGVSAFDFDISAEINRNKLMLIADLVLDEYFDAAGKDPNIRYALDVGLTYRFGVDGKDGYFDVAIDYAGGKVGDDEYWHAAKPAWKLDKPWAITCPKDNRCEFSDQKRYNDKLAQIYKRVKAIDAQIEAERGDNIYDEELIDLFIFDEVQDLLSNLGNKEDSAKLVREFIAGIQKKFCILVSATPIRDDLSDIFNLKYMIDKYSLGDTLAEAENRFYEGYCSGCRSLSEMAASENSREKFKSLNGLINRTFTRKRLSDTDVTESMRRQCATVAEREYAAAHGRSDYGGEKFINLIKAIVEASSSDNAAGDGADIIELAYTQALEHLSDETRGRISIEDFTSYLRMMHDRIDLSNKIEVERMNARTERGKRVELKIDICAQFLKLYEDLVMREQINDGIIEGTPTPPQVMEKLVSGCNMMCSYINRGLLDFYNKPGSKKGADGGETAEAQQSGVAGKKRGKKGGSGDKYGKSDSFSTVFLSEYVDWCRPVKRGVAIKIDAPAEKVALFADALTPDKEERISSGGLTADDIELLQRSKVLICESETEVRRDLYRKMRTETQNLGSSNRRVYMHMNADDVKEYTEDELIDLCRYNKSKCGQATHKRLTEIVNRFDKQPEAKRKAIEDNFEEMQKIANARSFIETWTENGSPTFKIEENDDDIKDTFDAVNTAKFSAAAIKNGDWNSVFFMNSNQRAGRNFQAANVLIVGQLDYNEVGGAGRNYLDPLDFEQLIGRICRTGQTEQCVIYTCLYTSYHDNIPEFNAAYYDILADKYGFDLFGECRTEVDFVVPVVVACIKRMFSPEFAYSCASGGALANVPFKAFFDGVDGEHFGSDKSDFKAVFRAGARLMTEKDQKKFPDLLRYAYENRDYIDVYIKDENWYTEEDGIALEDVDGGEIAKVFPPEIVESGDGTSRREVTYVMRKLNPIEAIKKMVRVYSQVLNHDVASVDKND